MPQVRSVNGKRLIAGQMMIIKNASIAAARRCGRRLASLSRPWLCACAKLLLGSVGGAVGLPKIARFEYFVERGSLVAEFFSRCRVEESSESSRVSRVKVVIYLDLLFISQKKMK